MVKNGWLFPLCFLSLLAATGAAAAAEEPVHLLNLHDPSQPMLQGLSHGSQSGTPSIAISLSNEQHLTEVSTSVLQAEAWVRTHVLAHYPSTKITTIVVGHSVFCTKTLEHRMGLVLPSVKNIHHSLTRWGLEAEIKVSSSFSSGCYRDDDLGHWHHYYLKPLLNLLQEMNSTYVVNPPPNLSEIGILSLVSSHRALIRKLGFFSLSRISVAMETPEEFTKPTSRKLSFMDFRGVLDPIPTVPNPLTQAPLPPLIGTFPPSPLPSPPSAPELAPVTNPPYGFDWPPCNPSSGGVGGPVGSPPPETGGEERQGMWCVAKPSVPAEALQEAMDYACGEGGGDCKEIAENGSCYHPDTVVAHASYAFNSYWQKNKDVGGTCSFGGTAMIINADPSFRHCRFVLS